MSPALHGHIVHRFELSKPPIDVAVSKRTTLKEKNGGHETGSAISENNVDTDEHVEHYNRCGFIFIPYNENSFANEEYFLSLPKHLLKLACDAVRSEREVMIRRYTEVSLDADFTGSTAVGGRNVLSSQSSPPTSSSTVNFMIEVHELDILPKSYQEESQSSSCTSIKPTKSCKPENKSNFWTLAQFWRKELVDFMSMKNSRSKFSILATVDAISPIIAMDPSNPFALIEAYDKDNSDITCIIVMHGNQAMLNHPAIHPLDTLLFRDVVYKPWSVPNLLNCDGNPKGSSASTVFCHLKGRIPTHVFVATRAARVSWNHVCLGSPQQDVSPIPHHSQDGIPAVITPMNLLTTLQGTVYNVATRSVTSGSLSATAIDYVDMILLDKPSGTFNDGCVSNELSIAFPEVRSIKGLSQNYQPRCRLYLSHFPMSTALQYSLRIGAMIQVYNIHLVCLQPTSSVKFDANLEIRWVYGTCLRSTLVLLKHATNEVPGATTKEIENRLTRDQRRKGSDIVRMQSFSPQPYDQPSTQMTSLLASSLPPRDGAQRHVNNSFKSKFPSIGPCLPFLNYCFRRIEQNYLSVVLSELVEDWEHRSYQRSLILPSGKCRLKEDVPKTWIVNTLLNLSGQNGLCKKRRGVHKSRDASLVRYIASNTKRKKRVRSPYAEFFDHPFTSYTSQQGDDGMDCRDFQCGCHLSLLGREYPPLGPFALLDLNEIRIASQRYFELHISKIFSSQSQNENPLQKLHQGFHGSIHVTRHELFSKLSKINFGTEGNRDVKCFVGGRVSELHTNASSDVAAIADGNCQIPIALHKKSSDHPSINDFIVGEFDSIIISCLCLSNLPRGFTEDEADDPLSIGFRSSVSKSLSLPTLNSSNSHLGGNCSLVAIHGLLFVTAVQMQCHKYQILQKLNSSSTKDDEMGLEDVTLTVEDCLATQNFFSEAFKPARVMGTVTRCQFNCKMNANGSHRCCRLTISSLKRAESKCLESDNSCLQALQMNLSVIPNTARMIKFNEVLEVVWPGVNLIEAQKILGSSFWLLGNSGQTCALTFGGGEDIIPGSSCSNSSVELNFPNCSLQLTKEGYTRSFCTQDRVDAVFLHHDLDIKGLQAKGTLREKNSSRFFDFVGGLKVMNGMLHQRLHRRFIARSADPSFRSVGELTTEPSSAIPLNTVSELFELIYKSLREPNLSHTTMKPSLVRRIANGRFLALAFCQAECYCTRCLCSLVQSSRTREGAPGKTKRKRQEISNEVSFWHLPHPNERLRGNHRTSRCNTSDSVNIRSKLAPHVRSADLRCPKNDCPKTMFGVKWECSGILDDGTGQATLYADGDAALTLLGMPVAKIQAIEEGLWSLPGGNIQFMKSIPPPKRIRENVINILAARKGTGTKDLKMTDPTKLLSVQDRAIYLLERHCRLSSRPRRSLDYYVRCKPLVTKNNTRIPHVQHTNINCFLQESGSPTIHRGQLASYSVPPLRLELVDCGVNSFQGIRTRFDRPESNYV